jgi:AraC-like DNA-binding protein
MPRGLRLPDHGLDDARLVCAFSREVGACAEAQREFRLPVERVHPDIHIGHRLVGNVALPWREIVDYEFIAVLEGQGDFHLGSSRFRYGPGSLLLIPPCVPHALLTRSGSEGDHMAVHFDWAPDLPGPRSTRGGNYRVVVEGLPPIGPVLSLDDTATGLLAEVVRQHRAVDPLGGLRASVALLRLLLHLAERGRVGSVGETGDEAVLAALACIGRHFAEDLRLEDLALAAGLQRSRFSERFKAWSGRAPMGFLRRYRIDRAGEVLVRHPERGLGEIALACGFADAFSFSKAFKAELGISPSTFRHLRSAS